MRSLATFAMLLLLIATAARGQDVIHRANGTRQPGKVVGIDDRALKVEVLLIPGQPAATVTIPRSEVVRVDFAEAEAERRLLAAGRAADPQQVAATWQQKQAYLRFPNSNAGAFALLHAHQLLRTKGREQEAFSLYERIASNDWSEARRDEAGRGKLSAMIATGRAAEAVEHARQLAINAEDPATLIEAKHVLAEASLKQLRELLEENPRWEEDEHVRPERHRLYHETLDLLLFPFLFYGSESEQAARGLWRATELYRLVGEAEQATETARDIAVLYPGTSFAGKAQKLLTSATAPAPAKTP
jgi:tetratricopeptide (TPR) repeat protein